MAGSGNAERRLAAFVDDRVGATGGAPGFASESAAALRARALREYREAREATRRGRAGLAADETQRNWVSIGPYAVRHGQADGQPVVSGRVPSLAVSADGQRVYVASANGGVWRSTDAARTWQPMSDELELHPTAASVDSLACGALALVEGAGPATDRLYVGTGEATAGLDWMPTGFLGAGMLRSDDGGTSWTAEPGRAGAMSATNDLLGQGVYAIAVDPDDPDLALAATTLGLLVRRPGGDWLREQLPSPPHTNITSVVVGRQGLTTTWIAAQRGGRVFRGAPGSWSPLQPIPATSDTVARVTLAMAPSAPVVYAFSAKQVPATDGTTDTVFNAVHRMDLSLAVPRWVRLTGAQGIPAGLTGNQGWYNHGIVVDPVDPDRIFVAGSGVNVGAPAGFVAALYRVRVTPPVGAATTTAAVAAHIGRAVHADVHELVLRPGSSDELWVGCDGGVFVTHDARGASPVFSSRNTGLATLTLTGLAAHPSEETWAFAGAQDNGGLRYDGWEVWDHQLPGDGGATVLDPGSTQILNIYNTAKVRRAGIAAARYVSQNVPPPAGANARFYPPMEQSPGQPTFVVFGGDRPYVTSDFGTSWAVVAGLPGIAVTHRIRSIAVVSSTRFYVGWQHGRVARYDRTGASAAWTRRDYSRPGETRPVTGMVVDPDPARPGGRAIYVCLGGAGPSSVWHLDTLLDDAKPTTAMTGWTDRSNSPGAVGTRLLPLHHSAILVDPLLGNHQRLWVAADLGVWTSSDGGATWSELSWNLPDTAVIDLDLVTVADPGQDFRLLRASTHGRGVYEMPLGGIAQPPVELLLRANQLDQRRRRPRVDVPLPTAPGTKTRLDQSPDLFVDTPDANGRYRLRPDRPPTVTELAELPPLAEVLASVAGTPAVTRVHVIVRNRGVRRVDGVRVTLLVGPKDAALPDSYSSCASGGALTPANGWQLAGATQVDGLRAGEPRVATIALSSESLPELAVCEGHDYQLIALLHHTDDPFPLAAPANTTVPSQVVTQVRHCAMKAVRVVSGRRRAAPGGGTGLLVSLSTTLLAQRRLLAVTTSLGAKVGASGGTVHPVERRVLAMARAGLGNLQAGPKPRVPAGIPGADIGSYALLGALGFELPAYTSTYSTGGGWVSENLRRGTGDPHLSNVAVAATELPLALAGARLPGADPAVSAALRAFTTGLLAAAAAGAVLSPQLTDLLARDTQSDWNPRSRSRGASALEHLLRRDVLGGSAGVTSLATWLPAAPDVPPALWDAYVGAIEQTYHLPGRRPPGFGSFEAELDTGSWLNAPRLAGGYGILLDDVRASSWSAWPWWGLLSPILLAPSIALLVARSLPHARAFTDGGELTERSFFELLTVAMGLGAIAPLTYSMVMWSQVIDHGEAFATALVMGLARGALVGAGLGTAGDEGQGAAVRWAAMLLPLAGADAYAAVRFLVGSGQRGSATVYALQTLPALTGLTTLALAGLARAVGGGAPERDTARDDTAAWALALGAGALLLGAVGIPLALALSRGGGWQSWFVRGTGDLPLLSATAHAGVEPLSPTAAARVFEDPSLWPALGASVQVDQQHYPAGMRALVRVWWEGVGELRLQYGGTSLQLRHGGVQTAVDLADPTSATTLVTQVEAALPGLRAELVGADAPALDLPRPTGLADAGDDLPHEAAAALRTGFVRVPTRRADALVLRQAPRVEQSTTAGRTAAAATPYLVFPADPTLDAPGSGLIDAADLAALLVTAAAPSSGPVVVDDTRPALPEPAVGEVTQVFRRWNLDQRRLDEWRSLVTGHGATGPAADPVRGGQNMLVRSHAPTYSPQATGRGVAEAMGWLPLWRAWLTLAGDTAADAGGTAIHAGTPQVAFPVGPPRRPSNRELTDGIRFLLDLGDT